MNRQSGRGDIRGKRIGASLRAALAVALAAGALFFANALSSRVYARWKTGGVPGLSDRTLEVLRGMRGVVDAVAVFERDHPFRDAARDLLDELREAAAGLPDLEFRISAIDVNHDVLEAAEAFREHPELSSNSILFSSGDRVRIVDEYELAGETGGRFDGERACAAALLRLAHPGAAVAYFLSGHGEYDPESRHPVTGASSLARALAASGFAAKKLVLGAQTPAVPADCRVLVVAGPRTVFPQRDREILADYLADGGRLLLLADDAGASGLGPLLELWGVRLDPPPARDGRAGRARRTAIVYGDHPAMRRMEGVLTAFASPCGVSESPPDGAAALPPRFSQLVLVDEPDGSLRCVAAVSEAARSPRGNTRVAVFGDAEFVSNALLDAGLEGNALLFLSAVEWLGDFGRPVAAGDPGGAFEPGVGAGRDWNRLGLALALGLPACILLFGLLVYVPLARLR
ncbi:MAG: Gldg family protein [Kiritimatiellae bacterium]|nr:Gldg family protein [Kiritimatiellia bacterium]